MKCYRAKVETQLFSTATKASKISMNDSRRRELKKIWKDIKYRRGWEIVSIHAVIQQTFTEHLPGSKHCARCWEYEDKSQSLCPQVVHRITSAQWPPLQICAFLPVNAL